MVRLSPSFVMSLTRYPLTFNVKIATDRKNSGKERPCGLIRGWERLFGCTKVFRNIFQIRHILERRILTKKVFEEFQNIIQWFSHEFFWRVGERTFFSLRSLSGETTIARIIRSGSNLDPSDGHIAKKTRKRLMCVGTLSVEAGTVSAANQTSAKESVGK